MALRLVTAAALAALAAASASSPAAPSSSSSSSSPSTAATTTVYSGVQDAFAEIVRRAERAAGGVAGRNPSGFIEAFLAEAHTAATGVWEALAPEVRAQALLDLEARKAQVKLGALPGYPDSYYAFAPSTLGAAYPPTSVGGAQPLSFPGPCFASNVLAVSALTPAAVTATLTSSSPNSSTCNDFYLVATVDGFTTVNVASAGAVNITLELSQSRGASSAQWLANNGVRIFRFQDANPWTTLYDVLATLSLYFPANVLDVFPDVGSQERNREFLADYANVTMPPRAWANVSGVVNGYVDVDESYFATGDLLAIHRLDGLSTLEEWGTGAHTSHIAFFYRNASQGNQLYVVESTDKTVYWAAPNIQMTPWPLWKNFSLACGYAMVHLPLKDEMAAKLDIPALETFITTTQGLPYGYHNFIPTFFDTPTQNLPAPVTIEAMEVIFGLVDELAPSFIDLILSSPMAIRLLGPGKNLTFVDASNLGHARNMSLGALLALPEMDSYRYWDTGDYASMVCDVYACTAYKFAGLFGGIADQIQCAEFENYDVYSLDFFNLTRTRPDVCVQADPNVPWCQLMGLYSMSLPGASTVQPYPNMVQSCPSEPPSFWRPAGC